MIPQVTMLLPPQDLDAEEAVLGAIMLEKDCYAEVENLLSPEIFYKDLHQTVFTAIQALVKKNLPIDTLTVKRELENTGFDFEKNGYDVVRLTSKVASSANIQYHALAIREKFMMREAIRITSEATKEGYSNPEDVFEFIDRTALKLNALSDVTSMVDEIPSLTDNLSEAIAHIEGTDRSRGITGVPTGFGQIDKITCGWQASDLIILAGRPGMSKTTAALQFGMNAAEQGFPGAFFSLEMKKLKLVMKMQANKSEIPFDKIKHNDLSGEDWQALNHACSTLSNYQIFIDDTSALKISTLKAKCRKLHKKGLLKWVVVDYIQLMNGSEGISGKGYREQEISFISRSLKNLAKELDVPIIALSQLSREVEKRRGNFEPILSDLRESGALEQDADIVIFVHRPEYYNILETEDGQSTRGLAQFIFAKYREGDPTRANLRFIPTISRFVDYDSSDFTPVKSPLEAEMVPGQNLTRSFYETDDDRPF